jgi:hypothetical protein
MLLGGIHATRLKFLFYTCCCPKIAALLGDMHYLLIRWLT